jgi:hypothetical protein
LLGLELWDRRLHLDVDTSNTESLGGIIPDLSKLAAMTTLKGDKSKRKRASDRADMIRAPMAIAEFTMRSFAPLKIAKSV